MDVEFRDTFTWRNARFTILNGFQQVTLELKNETGQGSRRNLDPAKMHMKVTPMLVSYARTD